MLYASPFSIFLMALLLLRTFNNYAFCFCAFILSFEYRRVMYLFPSIYTHTCSEPNHTCNIPTCVCQLFV